MKLLCIYRYNACCVFAQLACDDEIAWPLTGKLRGTHDERYGALWSSEAAVDYDRESATCCGEPVRWLARCRVCAVP